MAKEAPVNPVVKPAAAKQEPVITFKKRASSSLAVPFVASAEQPGPAANWEERLSSPRSRGGVLLEPASPPVHPRIGRSSQDPQVGH